jgi:hypothetical protein
MTTIFGVECESNSSAEQLRQQRQRALHNYRRGIETLREFYASVGKPSDSP